MNVTTAPIRFAIACLLAVGIAGTVGCSAPSPFVGHWAATNVKLDDGVRRNLELDMNRDGSYAGRNTVLNSGVVFMGQGKWMQTSPTDAVIIDDTPGPAMLLFLSGGTMTGSSRLGSVAFIKPVAAQ